MLEYRCTSCKKLLFKSQDCGSIEIVCPRCKRLNIINERPERHGEKHGKAHISVARR
ncbi:Com family DNA-binding transcriptional regulator [Oceanobacter mangrovi]|uniref:Com family DNA-binding transcriptional regulator n=1 Tax=Oceanobacter mangrovi TaxID=2862510 RepID=UPI001C8CF61D|nr:Com family DNA-binding transcriptional regulator [Oceanobacter mangrovi]